MSSSSIGVLNSIFQQIYKYFCCPFSIIQFWNDLIGGTRYLDKHGIKPNVQFSTMDIQATYAMAAAGMGVSITNQINSLPDYEGVCHRKLVPAELIEIGLAWEKSLSPVAGKFLEFIRTEGLMP